MAERVFLLPDPGEGLTEAELLEWLVAEGDEVELNQPIAEVETSKAAVEIPSPYAGRIARLHAAAGDMVPVGSPLVTFEVTSISEVEGEGSGAGVSRSHADVRATPAVRKLARDLDVDLASIVGSGPEGRITADDVQGAGSGHGSEDLRVTEVPLTATRRSIAANLERQVAVPQVTTFRTMDATGLDGYRRELEVSPLPILLRALASVVPAHPYLNAQWGDPILLFGKVNVGIAMDTERGLVVAVLKDAGRKGIRELSGEIRALASAARASKLVPTDLALATIAVSNTGSYGSEAGTPILSPGTAVTLAMGVIAPRALVVEGEVVARPACTLSLTFDHRVLDGAAAGRALTDLVDLLQSAERLRDLPA